MKIFFAVKSACTNLYTLLFITGFLAAGYICLEMQDDYESRIFVLIANQVAGMEKNQPQDSLIKKAVSTTYNLLHNRSVFFKGAVAQGFLDDFIHPLSSDLMTAEGACGSYSSILCRILNTMNIETRFAQMKVNGLYGGHIVIEAKTQHGWAVLDPLYNLVFVNPVGQSASFSEVAANWPWYRQQTPADYDMKYNYAGVRYTNWNKIPVLMPLLKQSLSFCMSAEQLEHLSIRNYFLRKYKVCANILAILLATLSALLLYKFFPYRLQRTQWSALSRVQYNALPGRLVKH